ncbi:MAG: hypothetical protein C5B49_16240 [Bdellovibrio sp.]|nr:MAG: hypothetical protein C5B49_16240 [Bdellovibrio sp.]
MERLLVVLLTLLLAQEVLAEFSVCNEVQPCKVAYTGLWICSVITEDFQHEITGTSARSKTAALRNLERNCMKWAEDAAYCRMVRREAADTCWYFRG